MSAGPHDWLFLTPEYPPGSGGVGDYAKLVAERLAQSGDRVEVWTPPNGALRDAAAADVPVHVLPDHFGPRSARALGAALEHAPRDAVLLVQYVPHGFGWKGMNLPFSTWLGGRRERVWLMVHEPLYPFVKGQTLRRDVLASATWAMSRLVLRNAERVFVSTPAWESFLPRSARAEWLPIPATIAPGDDSEPTPASDRPRVAHFGTYGEHLAPPLVEIFSELALRREDVEIELIGRGSEEFRASFLRAHPALSERVRATGALPADAVGRALAAAWVVVFPFIEGATARRTSLMSALAAGAAIVTTEGWCSESIWRDSHAVELVEIGQHRALVESALALLADERRRSALRENARRLYRERFHLDRVVERLRELSSRAARPG